MSPGARNDSPTAIVATPPIATAVRVIKENENARSAEYRERKRSIDSAVDKSPPYRRRSPSPVASPVQQHAMRLSAFEPIKLIKRSSSIEIDDTMYDGDSDDQRAIDDGEPRDMRYDSDAERELDTHDDGNNQSADNDAPLDLSVSAGRRRDRTYSGTDSDDSAGVGEEKAGGKAAYKKSLMKRYCKSNHSILLVKLASCVCSVLWVNNPHRPNKGRHINLERRLYLSFAHPAIPFPTKFANNFCAQNN